MKRTPLRRKKRLPPENAERKRARYEKQFGDKAAWLRQMNCCVCGRLPSDPHHVRSRGAGGTAKDLIPLCHFHHRMIHDQGIETFAYTHGLDLDALAFKYEDWWQRHQSGDTTLGF